MLGEGNQIPLLREAVSSLPLLLQMGREPQLGSVPSISFIPSEGPTPSSDSYFLSVRPRRRLGAEESGLLH